MSYSASRLKMLLAFTFYSLLLTQFQQNDGTDQNTPASLWSILASFSKKKSSLVAGRTD
jgi:hypothetical protein